MGASDEAPSEGDILRIMIATDNHLGYMEADPVRKEDSFNAFEEIFKVARDHGVDCVLLGGDLFHENKPSRYTLVRTMEILRKYCLNDNPVKLQVLSDQAANFPTKFGTVNYEDPNFNVGMPVFSIHGNHDDPSGTDNLAALDILATCNLVNYFGKTMFGCQRKEGAGGVSISPVLLRKGVTRVALYGLGHIRDERLGRMFQTRQVEWIRPADTPEHSAKDWFNIFVLHQNRVARGSITAKNMVKESFLPKFLDFVVWGHEHDSQPDPVNNRDTGCDITQPGSSVATSLSEEEALKKHVVLLEIAASVGENTETENQWRCEPVALKTVRPFVFDTLALKDHIDMDPSDQKIAEEIARVLESKVDEMIARAHHDHDPNAESMLPLIRLKVDYTGFSTINSQRFGHRLVDRVANPPDVLAWQKQPQRRAKPDAAGNATDEMDNLDLRMMPEALDQERIERLISEHLPQKLEILSEKDLTLALESFVNKDEKLAIANAVTSTLQAKRDELAKDPNAASAAEIKKAMDRHEGTIRDNRESVKEAAAKAKASSSSRGKQPAAASRTRGPLDGFLNKDSDTPATQSQRTSAARKAKAPAKPKRGKAKVVSSESDEDEDMADDILDSDSDDDLAADMSPTPAKGRKRGRAAAAEEEQATPSRGTTRGRGRGRGRGRSVPAEENDSPPPKRGRAPAAAAKAPEVVDLMSDDDDEVRPTVRSGRGTQQTTQSTQPKMRAAPKSFGRLK